MTSCAPWVTRGDGSQPGHGWGSPRTRARSNTTGSRATEPLPDDRELYDPFLDIVLDDMRDRSEDWCIALSPLPDGLGWRADFLIGDAQIRAGSAGDTVATKAIVLAVGRGIAAIDEACEEMSDEELT